MTVKTTDYWLALNQLASDIAVLSDEIQTPIIEQHFNECDIHEMDVAELTHQISQYHTTEDSQRWFILEQQGELISSKYGIEHSDLNNDLNIAMTHIAMSDSSSVLH